MVEEIPLQGLSVDEITTWVEDMGGTPLPPEDVHRLTGGHPLALELLEIYGQPTHGDWLKFLDEEIIRLKSVKETLNTLITFSVQVIATAATADSINSVIL